LIANCGLPIADFRLLISGLIKSAIGNRQLAMI
jgi:hypothetical protein